MGFLDPAKGRLFAAAVGAFDLSGALLGGVVVAFDGGQAGLA